MAGASKRKEGYSREYPYLTDKRVREVREVYRKLGRTDLIDQDEGEWSRRVRRIHPRKPQPQGIQVTDGSGMTLAEKIAWKKKLAGW